VTAASYFTVGHSKKKTTPNLEEAHSPETQVDCNLHTSVASLSSSLTIWKGISTGMAFLFLSTKHSFWVHQFVKLSNTIIHLHLCLVVKEITIEMYICDCQG
jgi:hypothetical protein